MSNLRFACSMAFAMFVASAPAFADIVFTDGTFDPATYTQVGPYLSNATISPSQCAACGNPGSALQIMVSITGASGAAAEGFVNNTFSYDPLTQGAILSIDASVDKDLTSAATLSSSFHPLIEQDGNYYLATIAGPGLTGPGTTGFNTISQNGLLATDFLQYDFSTGTFGTANPNFAGDPILLGLASVASGSTFDATVVYDNLSLDLSTAPVPEPSSVWLLVTLLAFAGLAVRRSAFNSR